LDALDAEDATSGGRKMSRTEDHHEEKDTEKEDELKAIKSRWEKLTRKKGGAGTSGAKGGAADNRSSTVTTDSADAGRAPGKGALAKHLTMEEIEQQFEQSVGLGKLIQSCNFMGVNVYSRSIFNEDVLANISLEQIRDEKTGQPVKLAGSIRIRSRAQGIALSLGDRISVVQRGELVS
jgi:hypothetical protein